MTLAQIMTAAWSIHRDRRGAFSSALKMAWALSRGFTHCFEVSLEDGSRIVSGASSSDEARKAFFAAERAALKRGVRSLGGTQSINLKLYAPVVEIEQPMKLAA